MTPLPTNPDASSSRAFHAQGWFARSTPVLALLFASVPVGVILLKQGQLPLYWQAMGLYWLLLWCVVSGAVAFLLKRCWPAQASFFLLMALSVLFTLVIGIAPVLSVLLLFISSVLLGQRLLAWLIRDEPAVITLMLPFYCGLALYLTLFGLMLHFRINFPIIHVALLLLPLLATLRQHDHAATRLYSHCSQRMQQFLQQVPYPLLVLLVMVVGFAGSYAFLPTMGSDDLHLHLRLWTDLSWQRKAGFDVVTDVWALAPFAVDLQHAITSLLAGQDARSALVLLWALLLLRELWQIGEHLRVPSTGRVLSVLLFVSTPMFANQLITLQTELFMALLVTSGSRLVLEASKNLSAHYLAGLFSLIALAVAVKLTGAAVAAFLFLAALLAWRRQQPWRILLQRPWQWLLLLAVLALLALHAYAYAWHRTGNPVFPLYNAVFKSPFFANDSNMIDERWLSGFSLKSYWDVFFATSRHHEGFDYSAGFQYLLLLPLALLSLWQRKERNHWALLLIPLLGFGCVMFGSLQYWRYLFPVLPLASVMLMALWPTDVAATSARSRQLISAAFTLTILLNIYFLPGVIWLLQNSPLLALTSNARERMIETTSPELAVNARLSSIASTSVTSNNPRVLYGGGNSYGATLNGQPVYIEWLSPTMQAKANAVSSYDGIGAFLKDNRIDYVVMNQKQLEDPGSQRWWLGHYLSRFAFPEFQIGSQIVYRMNEAELPYQNLFSLESWAAANDTSLPLVATSEPLAVTRIELLRARALRYHVQYHCDDTSGYYVAQLNWNNDQSYYRLVPCSDAVDFQESIPVPVGATSAQLYFTARDRSAVSVNALTIEKF